MRRSSVLRLSGAAVIAAFAAPTSALADAPTHHTPATATPHAPGAPAATKAKPNFDAMMSAIDKMFPPQPDPDPARLALARTSVQAMWPDGAYAKMMTGFFGNIFSGVMKMRKSDLALIGNKAPKTGASTVTDSQTIHDQAAAKDPYFDQRMIAMRSVIDEGIGKMSVIVDPHMREGLARSMARRFDARQLTDINVFFATPSGHALASDYMLLWFEPDTLRAMLGAFPEMMKLMPDAMQKFKAVNDKFPKPPASPAKATKH